ncbi:sigma-54 dependent transcriptional regulator [Pelagibius sp. 7325]|uniref:sigma-54-dependent transcriptional regulator n=1 Tax=Pelagibius sp. 7325 TaxID=3131994 RepID=UPI0030EF20CC
MTDGQVFFVDDEEPLRDAVKQGLELCGHPVTCFSSARQAEAQLGRNLYGVLVSDIKMPDMDGLALLRRALEIDPALPVVLVTGHGDVPLAVEAMRAGAYDFIEKPFDTSHLASVVARALEKRRLVLEVRALRQELETGSGLEARLVGRSAAMERLRGQVLALADTDADVLLVGETGAGKEVVARALHDFGGRRDGPFVAINCGAVPAEIIESELFGHVAGAFTGAQKPRTGKLEFADGGTVLLDEIESMPPALQVKLLRAIETRTIERLGSNTPVPLDIRFVAASKDDLAAACRAGRFREDLYYRLNVVSLTLPPLRERREDVPLLFHHLAREARGRYRREIPELDGGLLAALMAHDWPGNVRELRNAADRFVLGLGDVVPGGAVPALQESSGRWGQGPLSDRLDAVEKSILEAELRRHGGSLKATYEALGLSRKTLYDKLQRHGLRREDFLVSEEG